MRYFTILSILLIHISGILCSEKIRLEKVKALTLYDGRLTNSRRTSPVPQIKCVGGSAGCSAFVPKVVQCINQGSDGYDVQWECKADMSNRYRFGRIQVNCEGYDHPNDEYVLRGSCGLEYTLDLTESGRSRKKSSGGSSYQWSSKRSGLSNGLGNLTFIFVVVGGIIFIYFVCLKSNSTDDRHPGTGRPMGAPPPYPGTPDSGYQAPPPPGFRPEYTSGYSDDCGTRYRATPSAPEPASPDNNSGGGFWTGAAVGSLAGYLFGSSGQSSQSHYHYSEPRRERLYPDVSQFRDSSSSSGSDCGTRTASGFGGTTRR